MFTNICAFGFIVFVIVMAFLFLFEHREKGETDKPEEQAVTIYRMCRKLLGSPTWADLKTEKLTIEKSGDVITITLISGEVVFNASHAVHILDEAGKLADLPTEINEYHPGAWVQYLITIYEDEMADRQRATAERKSKKFAKIDDAELFGVDNDSLNG